ncbi:hypothetical protein PISMIDRAFT_16472 [Pisolithus microcarpus 441]|uniref:Uncharacterized protein n=1 Tax=Pisolithus microcarpus 441 TaxID=765257 RepID=A0A0C9YZL2_9AGAM|nr:hypothetical protein PISMIDRAFT_16472 [Pisolithus microcarpus 441]
MCRSSPYTPGWGAPLVGLLGMMTVAEHTLIETDDTVLAVAFANESHVVGGYFDGDIRRRRIEDGQEQGQTLTAGDPILSIAVSQDGQWIVSEDRGKKATVWNAATHEKVLDTKHQSRWKTPMQAQPQIVGAASSEAKPRRSSVPTLTVTNMLFAVTTIRRCMPALLVKALSNAEAVAMQTKIGSQEIYILRRLPQSALLFPQSRSGYPMRQTLTTSHPLNTHPGYAKGTPFKVSTLSRWIVFIGRQHLEDIKESADDELSLIEAANDQQSAEVDSLIGPEINSNRYHIPVTRTHLTLNLGLYYPDIEDEVHTAFEELFNLMDNGAIDELFVEGRSSSGNHTGHRTRIQQHLGSSSSCRFVWIDLNTRLVTTDANVFNIFPEFLNDILQWLLNGVTRVPDKAVDPACVNHSILPRYMYVFPAVEGYVDHESSYNLAAYPRYVGLLRAEVDAIIWEPGTWTDKRDDRVDLQGCQLPGRDSVPRRYLTPVI